MNYKLIESKYKDLPIIEQIFANRGLDPRIVEDYFNTTDDNIYDPSIIDRIHDGVSMLIKHIKNNDKIFVQVDADCDGYTSSAILINYLHDLFPHFVESNLSYRLHEGKEHGVILDTVPEGTKMVIIPDAGSNQYEEHKVLESAGVDVLVIDHHEAEKISECACIINNQLCNYPTKSLSGAGMVFKFCSYIDRLLGTDKARNYLDLAALGIDADVMSLVDFETRHIIKEGFKNVQNPMFSAMCDKNAYSMSNSINPMSVAFYIAPYVNAAVRSGTMEEKEIIFQSMLNYKAYNIIPSTKRGCKGQTESIVEQACRYMANIKNRQTKACDAGMEYVEQVIEAYDLLKNKVLVIQISDGVIDRNLTGLIANKLMSKYQRPVIILHKRKNEKDEITYEGSARNYDKSEFKDFKDFCGNSGYAIYAEGHQGAFGIGFKEDDVVKFISYANKELKDFEFEPCYLVDFIYRDNFSPQDILKIASIEPIWGQGIGEPKVAVEEVALKKDAITLMSRDKNPTLKLRLPNGIDAIKFKSSEEEYEKLTENEITKITLVGRCSLNIWNGNTSGQILIDDYEVVGSIKYYF